MTLLPKSNFLHKKMTLSLLMGFMVSSASFYAPITSAAPIYKIVDEKTGQITFTDRPQNYANTSGKQISETSVSTDTRPSSNGVNNSSVANSGPAVSNNPVVASNTPPPAMANATSSAQASRVSYQLTMIEPSEERAYRRPAQSIDVNVQVKPALQAGDSVSIMFDGNEVAQGLRTSISTVDILPGAHSIKAMIKDKKGQTLRQVERTVYIIQNTQTLQKNKKLAEQLLAYQRLPWHQKVLLKLRQDGKQPNMQTFNKPQVDTPMTLEQPAIK